MNSLCLLGPPQNPTELPVNHHRRLVPFQKVCHTKPQDPSHGPANDQSMTMFVLTRGTGVGTGVCIIPGMLAKMKPMALRSQHVLDEKYKTPRQPKQSIVVDKPKAPAPNVKERK